MIMSLKRLLPILFLLVSASAYILPPGLQEAANQTLADAQKITLVVAFIGGLFSFLSPCVFPIFPAFFSVTFKERKRLFVALTTFFLGFTLVFVLLGAFASYLGSTLITNREQLAVASGVLMVLFGLWILKGGMFSFVDAKVKRKDLLGIFFMGLLFGAGWVPCVGPILAGIIVLASTTTSLWSGAFLLFVYSLGVALPFFVLALFFERSKGFAKLAAKYGKQITGLLLVGTGLFFIFYQGSGILNTITFLDPLKQFFYTGQREVMKILVR